MRKVMVLAMILPGKASLALHITKKPQQRVIRLLIILGAVSEDLMVKMARTARMAFQVHPVLMARLPILGLPILIMLTVQTCIRFRLTIQSISA